MKRLLFLTLIAAVAGVAVRQVVLTGGPASEIAADDGPAGDGPFTQEVQGVGRVEPASEVRRLMMRTGGVVKRCRVKAGEVVRKAPAG